MHHVDSLSSLLKTPVRTHLAQPQSHSCGSAPIPQAAPILKTAPTLPLAFDTNPKRNGQLEMSRVTCLQPKNNLSQLFLFELPLQLPSSDPPPRRRDDCKYPLHCSVFLLVWNVLFRPEQALASGRIVDTLVLATHQDEGDTPSFPHPLHTCTTLLHLHT